MRKFSSILIVILAGWIFSIGVIAQSEINVQITPPNPTFQDPISIQISGTWENSCVPGNPQVSIENHHITIATSHPSEYCLMVLMPFELKVNIGKLLSGTYRVTVTFGSADQPPEEIATTSFQVREKGAGEKVKFRGTVVDQEHQPGGGWWKVKVEDHLSGPEITGDVAKVYYMVIPECIFSSDEDIEVGDRVEVFGELRPPNEVSLCNSGYIKKVDNYTQSGIFPNPVNSKTAILHLEDPFDTITLMIFDLTGKKVLENSYTQNDTIVNLSNLDNGVYLYVLMIQKDGNSLKSPVKKLLVQQ